MNREARVFDDFGAADEADRAHYAAMTPDERLALVLELSYRHREEHGEASEGLARVYRVTDLDGS